MRSCAAIIEFKHGQNERMLKACLLLGMVSVVLFLYWTCFLAKPEVIVKTKIVCIEDLETRDTKGIETVKVLFESKENTTCHASYSKILPLSKDSNAVDACVSNYDKDYRKWHKRFWKGDAQYIRHTYHKYLTSESVIVDVGGNVGDDAAFFIYNFKPKKYVLLEPVKYLYRKLVRRFRNNKNVIVYNIGLGFKHEKFMLNIEGNEGDATSIFSPELDGTCSLKVVNSTKFFIKLGLGCFDIDLLTINCEGCEFAVLENLVSTNQILFIKHLQFATHTKISRIREPVVRYCQLQEMLKKTHYVGYQFKFNWETWIRKESVL